MKLVLIRHGQSIWNLENRFTGWTDVDLSERGLEEARQAGVILKKHGYVFDVAFTSVLKRAIRTLWIGLHEMDLMWIPEQRVVAYWNEHIVPAIRNNKRVMISAHGNSIRALMKYLDNIPADGVVDLNIPTGIPLVYELDGNLKPIRHYYLGIDGEIPDGIIPASI